MKKDIRLIFILVAMFILGASCSREEPEGTFRIGIRITGEETLKSVIAEHGVTAALVSVAGEDGQLMYDQEYLPVYAFGESYTSRSLKLPSGRYYLEAFLLVDSAGVVRWATPRQGSSLARLVEDPLPVAFAVRPEQTTTVQMQVVRTAEYQPSDFGYASFEIEFVEQFCLQVYYSTRCMETWNDSILGPDGSGAPIHMPMLSVRNNSGRLIMLEPLNPGLNRYRLPIMNDPYILEATDCMGQVIYEETFLLRQLMQHTCSETDPPLVIFRDSVPGILVTPEGLKAPTIRQGVFGQLSFGLDSYMIQDSTELPNMARELFFYPYHIVDSLFMMAPIDCHFPVQWIQDPPVTVVMSNSDGYYQVPMEPGAYLYLVRDGGYYFWDPYVSSHLPGHVEVFRDSVTIRNIHIIDCSMWMQVDEADPRD